MEDKSKTDVQFTERQLHILELWEECANAEEIADKLGISVHTVVTHLRRMRAKLGVKRTFEVYRYVNFHKRCKK